MREGKLLSPYSSKLTISENKKSNPLELNKHS
jgi:hypothetical protein